MSIPLLLEIRKDKLYGIRTKH